MFKNLLSARKELKHPTLAVIMIMNLSLIMKILQGNEDISRIYSILLFAVMALLMGYFAIYLKEVDAFIILVGVMLITPPFILAESLPGIRLDEILIFFLLLRFILRDAGAALGELKPLYKPIAIVGGYILISIFYSAFFLHYTPIMRDFFEYIRMGKYLAAFAVALLLIKRFSAGDIRKFTKHFIYISSILLLFCLYQYLGYYNFNTNISGFFTNELHVFAMNNSRRISGTLGDPNSTGFFLGIFLTFIAVRGLFSDSQDKTLSIRSLSFVVPAVLCGASLVALMWTMSRTNILAILICLAYISYLLIKDSRVKGHKNLILIILTAVTAITVIIFLSNPVFMDRMLSGLRITGDKSFMSRLDKWADTMKHIKQSPIFGWGPAKDKFASAAPVDNEYLLVLRKYGLIGFGIYALGFYLLYRESSRALRSSKYKWLGIYMRCILIILLLFNITGGILYHMQLMPLLLMIAAFIHGLTAGEDEVKLRDNLKLPAAAVYTIQE